MDKCQGVSDNTHFNCVSKISDCCHKACDEGNHACIYDCETYAHNHCIKMPVRPLHSGDPIQPQPVSISKPTLQPKHDSAHPKPAQNDWDDINMNMKHIIKSKGIKVNTKNIPDVVNCAISKLKLKYHDNHVSNISDEEQEDMIHSCIKLHSNLNIIILVLVITLLSLLGFTIFKMYSNLKVR